MTLSILVSGGGPGGLACAIEAATKFPDAQIELVEYRPGAARPQRLRIDDETAAWYQALWDHDDPDDNHFFQEERHGQWGALTELIDGHTTDEHPRQTFQADVSEMENFLWRKVGRYTNIRVHRPAKVVNIDLDSNKATIKQDAVEKIVRFDHIFAFDGTRHPTLSLLDVPNKPRFSYQEFQGRHITSGTILLDVEESALAELDHNGFLPNWHSSKEDMAAFVGLGWEHEYPPRVYVFPSQGNTYYVAGEIPQWFYPLYKEDREQFNFQLKAWADISLRRMCGFHSGHTTLHQLKDDSDTINNPKLLAVKKKRQDLITSAFPVLLTATDDPCIPLPSGGYYVMGGDTARVAYYQLAHGVSDSTRAARAIIRNISQDGEFNAKAYRDFDQEVHQVMLSQMKAMHVESSQQKRIMLTLITEHKHIIDLIKDIPRLLIEADTLRSSYPASFDEYGQYYSAMLSTIGRIDKILSESNEEQAYLIRLSISSLLQKTLNHLAELVELEKGQLEELIVQYTVPFGTLPFVEQLDSYKRIFMRLSHYTQEHHEILETQDKSLIFNDMDLEDRLVQCVQKQLNYHLTKLSHGAMINEKDRMDYLDSHVIPLVIGSPEVYQVVKESILREKPTFSLSFDVIESRLPVAVRGKLRL